MREVLRKITAIAIVLAMMLPSKVMAAENASKMLSNEETNNDEAVNEVSEIGYVEELSEDASALEKSEDYGNVHSYVENAIEAENGIVQVNCVYIDDSGKSHIIKGGTGFVIGIISDNSNSRHVLSCKSAIVPDASVVKSALRSFGVKKADLDEKIKNISYEVVVTQDMTVSATVFQESEKLDLIVFYVNDALASKIPLSIYTSNDDSSSNLPYEVMGTVHALGLPDAISYDSNAVYYSKKDVGLSSGIITNLLNYEGNQSIAHTAIVGANNCGGPLVNDAGNVIGMNVASQYGQAYVAIDSTELVDVLTSFGIEFNRLTPNSMGENATEDSSVMEASAEIVSSDGTEGQASSVPVWIIVVLIIVSLLLITTIVFVVIMGYRQNKPMTAEEIRKMEADKARKKEERLKKKEEKAKKKNQSQELNKPFSPIANPMVNIHQNGGMGMETNTLSSEIENETTILSNEPTFGQSQESIVNGGTLIRKKTGDNIVICKPITTIGKDSLHVDYCIRDNSAISRIHTTIKVTPQGVFIEDENSTNGTFVNGVKLGTDEIKFLNKGDVIRLGDEEFEYRK